MAQEQSKWVQRIMWIVWPSFLMAGVMEILVFSMVDPEDLQWFGQQLEFSRQGIYTMAFFAFWLIIGISGALSVLLSPHQPSEPDH